MASGSSREHPEQQDLGDLQLGETITPTSLAQAQQGHPVQLTAAQAAQAQASARPVLYVVLAPEIPAEPAQTAPQQVIPAEMLQTESFPAIPMSPLTPGAGFRERLLFPGARPHEQPQTPHKRPRTSEIPIPRGPPEIPQVTTPMQVARRPRLDPASAERPPHIQPGGPQLMGQPRPGQHLYGMYPEPLYPFGGISSGSGLSLAAPSIPGLVKGTLEAATGLEESGPSSSRGGPAVKTEALLAALATLLGQTQAPLPQSLQAASAGILQAASGSSPMSPTPSVASREAQQEGGLVGSEEFRRSEQSSRLEASHMALLAASLTSHSRPPSQPHPTRTLYQEQPGGRTLWLRTPISLPGLVTEPAESPSLGPPVSPTGSTTAAVSTPTPVSTRALSSLLEQIMYTPTEGPSPSEAGPSVCPQTSALSSSRGGGPQGAVVRLLDILEGAQGPRSSPPRPHVPETAPGAPSVVQAQDERFQQDRKITCKTYLKRLNVTQFMAEHLLPPYLSVVQLPRPAQAGPSSYDVLFKEEILLVDEGGVCWPVVYEGVLCNNQRHLRFTNGWRDFVKSQNIVIGDTVNFERRGQDYRHLYVRVIRSMPARPSGGTSQTITTSAPAQGGHSS